MSDMVGVTASAGHGGNGRTQNGASRAAQGPVPVNPHPASGVRTPTDIMRQRRDREARKKAEQEAREQEEQELQSQKYAAGVAGDRTSQRRSAAPRAPTGPEIQPDPRTASAQGAPSGYQRRSDPQAQPGSQPPHVQFQGAPGPGTFPKQPAQGAPPSQSSSSQPPQQQQRRVAFPHAFERWETLSSHWEGLTGYWIRKLEQNNEAFERDTLSQQMARQVTDLSAAGANLFHAVVELQRLRASSERKFQRWFFDTRAEQERAKELQGDLEKQVKTERQARSEAFASLQKAESDKARAEDLLKEMRRELQISKEEARRAWEELGRREQEERDRTTSLRSGEPTLVGGVQVVPMVQGLPNRSTTSNRPSTRDDTSYHGASMGSETGRAGDGRYYDNAPSPTGSDPFTERRNESEAQRYGSRQPPVSSAPESSGQYAGQFFEHDSATYPGQTLDDADDRSFVPSAPSSERGDEEYGSYRRDAQGRPVVYPRPMSEESDENDNIHDVTQAEYIPSTLASTSAPLYTGYTPTSSDYTGSDWGVGTGWESMTPRHRHPTRLSDVLEEEEPRTTPSRASQASRSMQ